ncbi:MAG TPA: glycosyltransferase [Chryseosolibacter sp.]
MVVLTGIFVVYFLLLVILLVGWSWAMNMPFKETGSKEPLISVIIPVRNEELTIGKLLTHLSFQEYKNFEIIIVNDDSEDETLWMISRYDVKNLNVIHNQGWGKKAAITSGIRVAKGTIIVTTDADCIVPPGWLKHIHSIFRDREVMLAFGGVVMEGGESFFDSLQTMEFSSLIGSGAATVALGAPTMCNGANLAYRKKAFLEVKGYEDNLDIPSGDDEFLMRKIHKLYEDGIRFINTPEAVVTTRSQRNPQAFLNQRTRWASKWRYNSAPAPRTLAVGVVLFQLAFIGNWLLFFSPFILQSLFLAGVKMILEAAFLLQVCRFLGAKWNWLAFFTLQIVHPLYVIGVGITSFFRPFEWKHRTFRPG